jgi:hypothetical protein
MTIEEVVRQVLCDEHADVIRESVRVVAQEMMELEVFELVGAELGERTDDRATDRNGYRPRRWDTRAGEIKLQIPRARAAGVHPIPHAARAHASRRGDQPREENFKHPAVFRLALGRAIPNVHASWVKMGLDTATEALRSGVNDFGGTLMEENISRLAGSYHGVRLDPPELIAAAHRAGRPAVEGTTLYDIRRATRHRDRGVDRPHDASGGAPAAGSGSGSGVLR